MIRSITPRQALLVSVLAALLTISIKGAAWRLTGSVGYLSDALESLVNLAGATFALIMVTYAHRPPDDDHPFGHGKAEYFSAAFEGGLIFIAALAILAAAIERLINPRELGDLGLGTLLSILATVLNLLVARLLFRVGREHRSIALEADARHLMTDVWTTIGVILGVALASLSGLGWLDPLVAIVVAVNILREGWHLMYRAVNGLMDRALSDEQVLQIEAILNSYSEQHGARFLNLRTREAGARQFAQVDVRVPGDWSVTRAHDLADAVEREVKASTHTLLSTHIEPMSAHPERDSLPATRQP